MYMKQDFRLKSRQSDIYSFRSMHFFQLQKVLNWSVWTAN